MKIAVPALFALLALAACGRKVDLQPTSTAPLPPALRTAAAQPGPKELLAPPSATRPGRVDDAVSNSRPREPDRFDLPPTG